IPNPLSWWLHFRPHWFHQFGCFWNHVIELIIPWFAFGPRTYRHIAGILLVSFQFFLILSGNLSFLNWLTIAPALACFDDSFWEKILPKRITTAARIAETSAVPCTLGSRCALGLTVLLALLSIAPVANMISTHQIMNTSFTRLHLVNTYGAFGS